MQSDTETAPVTSKSDRKSAWLLACGRRHYTAALRSDDGTFGAVHGSRQAFAPAIPTTGNTAPSQRVLDSDGVAVISSYGCAHFLGALRRYLQWLRNLIARSHGGMPSSAASIDVQRICAVATTGSFLVGRAATIFLLARPRLRFPL